MSNKLNSDKYFGYNFLLSRETQGIKLGLSRTKKLLSYCQNPEQKLKSIQIIGTNGKGSTAAFLSNILMCHGLKIGLYTSPHLVRLNERIQINRRCISNDYINEFISLYKNKIINLSCTFFETMTVLAICYFKDNNIDIAILETGLGGRYDSVTACSPSLQLFTSISKDHTHILGNDIIKITTEKAHAIQKRIPCISVPQSNKIKKVLDNFARSQSTKINYTLGKYKKNYKSPLIGQHQKENILLAIKASKQLYEISNNTINKGITSTYWPGRIQVIQKHPHIIFDVSHNEHSIAKFCKTIKEYKFKGKKTLIISLQKTKVIKESSIELMFFFDHIAS